MKKIYLLAFLALLTVSYHPILAAQQIPPGTVIPVVLETTLHSQHDEPGKRVAAKVMQDVLLADGAMIRKGSRITGQVISASPGAAGSPSRLAVRFDQIVVGGHRLSVTTHVRALASAHEVFEAKLPTNAIDDYGTSSSDWNTVQIGGAGVYRGSGEVVDGGRVVGRATDYGAVTAKLIAAPQRGCKNGGEREQALWLFSPWACGVYGYPDLKIAESGKTTSGGEIEFESSREVRIDSGSGLLLWVDRQASK